MGDTKIGMIGFVQSDEYVAIPLPPNTPLVFMTEPNSSLKEGDNINITGPIVTPGGTDISHKVVGMIIITGSEGPVAVQGDVVHVGLTTDLGIAAGDQVFLP